MNRSGYFYVGLIAALALSCGVILPWSDLAGFGGHHFFGLLSFVLLAVLAEAMAIDFAIGPRKSAKSSIAFLPLLACVVAFPPAASVSAVAALQAFSELFLKSKRIAWRFVFNLSQSIIAVALAAWVYDATGGTHVVGAEGEFRVAFVPFGFLVVTFFVANIAFVGGLYAIRQKQPFFGVIATIVGPGGGNLLYDLLASPIALVAAILYAAFYVGGLVLIILPLLLIRYSYLSKVQLQQVNRDLLRVLVKAIETRDPYTSGHSMRVSTLARAIAEDLRLPRRKVEEVETAALLHDIGKIDATYASLINKAASLSEEERAHIRTHATRGADLLQSLASLNSEVIQGVRHHHERYDGQGYPDGLKGKAIPLPARIIALCDAIDAMLSDRPYRPALTLEETRDELVRCAGTQFDPDIVDTILERNTLARAVALIEQPESALHEPLVV